MRGIILSHTRMTGEGFCTSLAVTNGEHIRQIRPRLAPNASTKITSFGLTEAEMVRNWRPGCPLEFETFESVQPPYVRPTHPEDVVFPPQKMRILPMLERDEFEGCIAQFTYPSLESLFPGLQDTGNGKAFVLKGTLERSLGYTRCQSVVFMPWTRDKVRTLVTDANGRGFDLPLKDVHLLQRIRAQAVDQTVYNVSVRFALAGPLTMCEGDDRCYVMVSHIHI